LILNHIQLSKRGKGDLIRKMEPQEVELMEVEEDELPDLVSS